MCPAAQLLTIYNPPHKRQYSPWNLSFQRCFDKKVKHSLWKNGSTLVTFCLFCNFRLVTCSRDVSNSIVNSTKSPAKNSLENHWRSFYAYCPFTISWDRQKFKAKCEMRSWLGGWASSNYFLTHVTSLECGYSGCTSE